MLFAMKITIALVYVAAASDAAHNLALCRASDWPYLSSIAWCIYLYYTQDIRASRIEKFWETENTGDISVLPRWSYGEVVANISDPPTMVMVQMDSMSEDMTLNMTALTTQDNWQATWVTLYYFFRETALESYFGLSICLAAFALPIVLTWLGCLPCMARPLERLKPYLYPSTIGTYHDRPFPFALGNAPTIGRGLYIALLAVRNLVFLCVGYKTAYPKNTFQWYTDRYEELMAYWMWRTGVLAFCQMSVLFLFATRNNILLWLSNWSHSTFMLLHRWVARFFLLQTLLHSILALVLYTKDGSYPKTLGTPMWIWGCVATVLAVLIVLLSVLIFRQRAYELFLVTHIVMTVIFVVACWYHVWFEAESCFGYETWLYATTAVWAFDRLARLARILSTGIRQVTVTDIGANLVRVDVPGIRWTMVPGHSVFVYFPTLNPLRPWENHPFSLVPTVMLAQHKYTCHLNSETDDLEKVNKVTIRSDALHTGKANTNTGVTLFVRKSAGLTGFLRAQEGLLMLLEGPYPFNSTGKVLESDRLVLLGGGIGITGLLPFLRFHPSVKLLYSVKNADQCLVDALSTILDHVPEREIAVGRRLDINSLLRSDADLGWSQISVVVCGSAGMCDDARAAVARLSREMAGVCSFTLEADAFSW